MQWLIDCLAVWYQWMRDFKIYGDLSLIQLVGCILTIVMVLGVVLPHLTAYDFLSGGSDDDD